MLKQGDKVVYVNPEGESYLYGKMGLVLEVNSTLAKVDFGKIGICEVRTVLEIDETMLDVYDGDTCDNGH